MKLTIATLFTALQTAASALWYRYKEILLDGKSNNPEGSRNRAYMFLNSFKTHEYIFWRKRVILMLAQLVPLCFSGWQYFVKWITLFNGISSLCHICIVKYCFCVVKVPLLFLQSRRVHSPNIRYSKNTLRRTHIFNNDVICAFYCVVQLLRDQIERVTVPAAGLKLHQSGVKHVKQWSSISGSKPNPWSQQFCEGSWTPKIILNELLITL